VISTGGHEKPIVDLLNDGHVIQTLDLFDMKWTHTKNMVHATGLVWGVHRPYNRGPDTCTARARSAWESFADHKSTKL